MQHHSFDTNTSLSSDRIPLESKFLDINFVGTEGLLLCGFNLSEDNVGKYCLLEGCSKISRKCYISVEIEENILNLSGTFFQVFEVNLLRISVI